MAPRDDDNVAFKRYPMLAAGENTYASPSGHPKESFRRVSGLTQSLAGELEREQRAVQFAPTVLPANGLFLHQYDRYTGGGVFVSHFFVATSTQLFRYSGGAWVQVTEVGTLAGAPVARNIDNLMHFSDGSTSWLFDGTNWVTDGLPLPPNAPEFTKTLGTGTPNKVSINRYYWTSYADQTATRREHWSSSSPQSVGTGVVANTGTVEVRQEPGTLSTSSASAVVTGVGTSFSQRHVGMKLYTSGQLQGTIASWQSATQVTLAANAATTTAAVRYVIAPSRATHWNIFASSSEEDKVGLYLASVLVTTVTYTDNNFMIGQGTSTFENTARPSLNDPPNATLVMEVRAKRLFRRKESVPNQITLSAFEEILSEGNGSPFESVPGADANSISEQSNEETYPDDSDIIRGLLDYGGSIMIGTEDEVTPFFGENLEDFGFSNAPIFKLGLAGRNAWFGCPFGLFFISYDHKIYLYPSRLASGGDDTTSLIELGRPKRKDWEQMKGSDLFNVHAVFYNWGRRNWAVICYQNEAGTYKTWGFDFESRGWFEFTTGCSAVAVWEVAAGKKALIGVRVSDKRVVVLDDLTGTYVGAGNYAVGMVRELVDFGDPDAEFSIQRVQFELSSASLVPQATIWLDPLDPENPDTGGNNGKLSTTTGGLLALTKTRLGANHYRATVSSGSTCQRALVELLIPDNAISGTIRGLSIYAQRQPWTVNK